jgi:DNA invertase Pin-like site-specific DNA recombinase
LGVSEPFGSSFFWKKVRANDRISAQVETFSKLEIGSEFLEQKLALCFPLPLFAEATKSQSSPQCMETTQTKTKCVLYARKSTEEDDQQIMSIEAQLFELREYAHREHIEIVKVFTEAKSAKKPGRDQFAKMIEYIESSNESLGILAWHPDRLARNSVDGGKIIYLVDINRIASLRFPQFWFEPTPQGKFMLQVAFGQSKYFSDNLVENVKRGIRQKIRKGEWLTLAPLGYVNNYKTKNIEPDKVKARIIINPLSKYPQYVTIQ